MTPAKSTLGCLQSTLKLTVSGPARAQSNDENDTVAHITNMYSCISHSVNYLNSICPVPLMC